MGNLEIDISVVPAKCKCKKCGEEMEIPPQKRLSDTMKLIKVLEEKHKNCQ